MGYRNTVLLLSLSNDLSQIRHRASTRSGSDTGRSAVVSQAREVVAIPVDQRWFWMQRWQNREREVDAHVAAGEISVHPNSEALLNHLDGLDTDADI